MPENAIPSPASLRSRMGNTGLLARVAEHMNNKPGVMHPAGVLRYQVDLQGAQDDEVEEVRAALAPDWRVEPQVLSDNRTLLLITENDEEKLALHDARRAQAVALKESMGAALARNEQLLTQCKREIGMLRAEHAAFMKTGALEP